MPITRICSQATAWISQIRFPIKIGSECNSSQSPAQTEPLDPARFVGVNIFRQLMITKPKLLYGTMVATYASHSFPHLTSPIAIKAIACLSVCLQRFPT